MTTPSASTIVPGRGAVPGFLPSVHGLRFANSFPPGPTLTIGPLDPRVLGFGDASAGLCGGMALTARDLFEAGMAAPPESAPPANGTPRFRALVRRQVQSLDWLRVPLRYLDLQALRPDPPSGLAALLHREPPRVVAIGDEWPRIRAEIDAGHPCVVGLIRAAGLSPWTLTANHQVLAFACEASEGLHHDRCLRSEPPGSGRRRAAGHDLGGREPALARADPPRPVDRRAAAGLLPPAVSTARRGRRLALISDPVRAEDTGPTRPSPDGGGLLPQGRRLSRAAGCGPRSPRRVARRRAQAPRHPRVVSRTSSSVQPTRCSESDSGSRTRARR